MENKHKELTLEEIHRASLDLLRFFHVFTEQNRLEYDLAYGTLLGCIRHNGFIPWDDDIDVWMPRKDFDRLFDLFRNNGFMIGNYKLCCRKSDARYEYSIFRFCDMRYQYFAKDQESCPDMGLFIDIYPLEATRSFRDYDIRRRLLKVIDQSYVTYCNPSSQNPAKQILKRLIRKGLNTVYNQDYLSAVERRTKKVLNLYNSEKSPCLSAMIWSVTNKSCFKREWFKNRILHRFEDLQLWIPEQYDAILTAHYGDYMRLPPLEKQTAYHNYTIVRRESE